VVAGGYARVGLETTRALGYRDSRGFLDSDMNGGDIPTAAFSLEALTDHALKDALTAAEGSPLRDGAEPRNGS
jgi:hypothetical protein